MRLALMAAALAAAAATPLFARGTVELTRAVFHERIGDSRSGRTIAPAGDLRKGDSVILVVRWNNSNGARGFTVSSPVPTALTYRSSSLDNQTVSVDGGISWGPLEAMHIREAGGKRRASPEDVTHLRWRITAQQAARGSGQLTYSAIVR